MTALCGGGTSAAKPGFNRTVVMTSAAIEAGLTALGYEPVALALAPIIAGTTYDLTNMCSTDPEPDPGLTLADVTDALDYANPSVNIPAVLKVLQWFRSWYWYTACECTSTSTPVAPVPSNPGTPVSVNPGMPAGSGPVCFQGQTTATQTQSTTETVVDITGAILPTAGAAITVTGVTIGLSAGLTQLMYPIPDAVQKMFFDAITMQYDQAMAASDRLTIAINFADSNGNYLTGQTLAQNGQLPGQTKQNAVFRNFAPWGAVAAYWGVAYVTAASATPSTVEQIETISSTAECTGSPLQAQCCPPDPTIEARLNQLLGLVQAIYGALPTKLNSFAESTVHAGLTGSGSFAIGSGTIAIRVELTTIPPSLGYANGNPIRYFEAGIITTSAAEGAYRSHNIQHSPEVFVLGTLVDAIHYTLNPLVVASITELTAGP